MSGPPVIHRQLDRCGVCGTKIHKMDLVRTQVRYNRPEGNNYFLYSYYDGSFWDNDGTVTLQSSPWGLGPDSEDARLRIGNESGFSDTITTTEIGGSKTFLLDSSPAIIYTASSTDISGFTSFVFGVYVGQYHANDDQAEMTVEIGNCNSDASTTYSLKSETIRAGKHIWVAANVADLDSNVDSSATYWYVKVTASSDEDFYFWVDWMQLERNASKPGHFISTSGAAEAYATEQKLLTTAKVCPDCKEYLLLESEQYGRPRQEVEPPVQEETQEV